MRKIKVKGRVMWEMADGSLLTTAQFNAFLKSLKAPPKKDAAFVEFKPLHSEALAVHPTQIQEARDDAVKKGIPTEFDAVGRPIFTSSRHFREYAKRYGFRHRGYA